MMTGGNINRLQKCGVTLSTLGLGVEHFAKGVRSVEHLSRDENSLQILKEAYNLGVTHYDLVYDLPYFYDVFRDFCKDKRDKITFTTHIGNLYNENTGKSAKSRSLDKIRASFNRKLDILETDYTDIALIQYIGNLDDYEMVVKRGLVDYVKELKETGRAKVIGVSGHNPGILLRILEDIEFDVVMTIINFATGRLDTRKNLIKECKDRNIAMIAIKNLHKGKLFTTKKTETSKMFSGGKPYKLQLKQAATAAQCFNFALDLGIDSVVFGVKTIEQLQENIHSFRTEKKVEYSHILEKFDEQDRLSS
ncbi:MAG: aldo/keto reductase [Candidatus Heimdallarchaeaceae archaeon]